MIDQLLEIFGRDSFQENIVAGLVVMVLDVVIVALAIGAFVKWLGDREWRGTRRHLAYVLLNSMDSVAGEINAAIEETDGRLVLNKDIRLRLQHLKIALSNFHTQTIVHLPAMRPPLSEKLSALTTRISKLEETIHAMDWHISALGAAIGSYDAKMPDAGWISPEFFGSEKNPLKDMPFHHMNFSIKSGSSLSEQNYIFLEITQSIERINSLASAVDELVESYSDGWKGIYFDEKESQWSVAQQLRDCEN